VNPFEPKYQLLQWTQPVYNGAAGAGTFVPYFGGYSWAGGVLFMQFNTPSFGRYRIPFDMVVRELSLFSQITPGDVTPETWNMFANDGATLLGSVTRAANARDGGPVRVNRLIRKGTIVTANFVIGVAINGAYNVIMTAACEQVSL